MKIILLLAGVAVLSGCSSQPKVSRLISDQFCHTSSETTLKDNTESSKVVTVKCNDDPIEKYAPVKMGIAKDCTRHYVSYNLNGRVRTEELIACKKFDGVSDIIESRTLR